MPRIPCLLGLTGVAPQYKGPEPTPTSNTGGVCQFPHFVSAGSPFPASAGESSPNSWAGTICCSSDFSSSTRDSSDECSIAASVVSTSKRALLRLPWVAPQRIRWPPPRLLCHAALGFGPPPPCPMYGPPVLPRVPGHCQQVADYFQLLLSVLLSNYY